MLNDLRYFLKASYLHDYIHAFALHRNDQGTLGNSRVIPSYRLINLDIDKFHHVEHFLFDAACLF